MAENSLTSVLRTLLVNGYTVTEVDRISQNAAILLIQKRNRLGGVGSSAMLLAEKPSGNVLALLKKRALQCQSQPLVVSPKPVNGIPGMTPETFYDLLGGEVRSDRLVRDDLSSVLDAFGHNRAYSGFDGDPDDLLEDFVKEGLQFLLESRAYRYGQERLFESLPDGLVLGRHRLNLYFDSKAYKDGFHPTADDIKRFSAYVADFNARYESLLGRLYCLIVVSGSFPKTKESLEEKAAEFYSACESKLCFLAAKDFGEIITDVRTKCSCRSAIRWKTIFSHVCIQPGLVHQEIKRIVADNIGSE